MNNFLIYRELIDDCLSDLWTLHLTFIGILLSLFTLLYSFILSKKDELKLSVEQIKLGDNNPLVIQRKNFAITYIKRLSGINRQCFYILLISIFLASCSWVGMRLLDEQIRLFALVTIAFLTLLVIGYIVFLAVRILRQYKDDIKI
jgi:amino acid permease